MASAIELRNQRLAKGKHHVDDIYHDNGLLALTQEQIQDIPIEKVYEWTKTGQWKQKHFKKWLKALRVI